MPLSSSCEFPPFFAVTQDAFTRRRLRTDKKKCISPSRNLRYFRRLPVQIRKGHNYLFFSRFFVAFHTSILRGKGYGIRGRGGGVLQSDPLPNWAPCLYITYLRLPPPPLLLLQDCSENHDETSYRNFNSHKVMPIFLTHTSALEPPPRAPPPLSCKEETINCNISKRFFDFLQNYLPGSKLGTFCTIPIPMPLT